MGKKEKNVQISLSVWESAMRRATALIEPMTEDMRRHGGEATRASVVRAALYEGLTKLEEQYLPDAPEPDEGEDDSDDAEETGD
jgi:hypothetical protein